MPSNHLILSCPLLLLPSIFPSIRVFSKESVLCIRRPKYWSFNFSLSTSNEYSGLISFRMDWLDLIAVQGTLNSLLQHSSSKAPILWHSAFFTSLSVCYKRTSPRNRQIEEMHRASGWGGAWSFPVLGSTIPSNSICSSTQTLSELTLLAFLQASSGGHDGGHWLCFQALSPPLKPECGTEIPNHPIKAGSPASLNLTKEISTRSQHLENSLGFRSAVLAWLTWSQHRMWQKG